MLLQLKKRGACPRRHYSGGLFPGGNVLRLASYFRSMFLFNIAHLLCRAVSSLNFARRPSSLVIICVAKSVFRRGCSSNVPVKMSFTFHFQTGIVTHCRFPTENVIRDTALRKMKKKPLTSGFLALTLSTDKFTRARQSSRQSCWQISNSPLRDVAVLEVVFIDAVRDISLETFRLKLEPSTTVYAVG